MTIYEIVEELKTKYRSSDPFELCDYLGVKVAVTYLGSLKGLYTFIDDVPVILISSAIKRIPQLLFCAHELIKGHISECCFFGSKHGAVTAAELHIIRTCLHKLKSTQQGL